MKSMKLVFGQIPEEFVDETEEQFPGVNASGDRANFYYMLEVNEEANGEGTFTIKDTCGRYVPFDFDNLDELIDILSDIQEYRNDRQEFIDHWKRRFGVPS